MLVLSRRVGQGIRIGDTIRVTVTAVDGQFVRLGLEAPQSCKILREELWCSVAEANAEATTTAEGDDVARTLASLLKPHSPGSPLGIPLPRGGEGGEDA